jgi:hypothetical protein
MAAGDGLCACPAHSAWIVGLDQVEAPSKAGLTVLPSRLNPFQFGREIHSQLKQLDALRLLRP